MDEGKKKHLKRVLAWIGALLFVLLIINIYTWQFQIGISLGVYILLIMMFLFVFNRKKPIEQDENDITENPDE